LLKTGLFFGKGGHRSQIGGLLFILPYAFLWGFFLIWPLAYGFFISLHKWDPLRGSKFIGLANYVKLFRSPIFWNAFFNTFEFAGIAVPLIIILGLVFALLMQRMSIRGGRFIEASLFFPYLLTVSIVSLVWKWLFDPDVGLVLYYSSRLGLHLPTFLADKFWALPAIAFATAWWLVGYRMVIFKAAMGDIPPELYESAELDGAGGYQKFRHITLPLLRPAILFALILTTISGFRVFGQVIMMTAGGPGRSSEVLALYLFRRGFDYLQMGLAAAVGFILFVIILIITVISFRFLGFESRL